MQPNLRPNLRVVGGGDAISQRRDFDDLARLTLPRISVERVEAREIPPLLAFAAGEIPALAAAGGAVSRVAERNRDSVWVFRRGVAPVGIYAMLHLSKDGLERLLLGELDTTQPDPRALVASGEAPSAIYKWAVVAPGMASAGICAISRMLQADRYATANLFARPTTMGGERIMASLGFGRVRSGLPDLHRYVRVANRVGHSMAAA